MAEKPVSYQSLEAPVEGVILKERKSKFIGNAYPIANEADIKDLLLKLKGKYPDANHICYAWQLGQKDVTYRVQDDGEPRNSAGKPIYGQINSFGITNIAVFVVRYFGGVKLGVGGLISAYRATARETLKQGIIKEFEVRLTYQLRFGYNNMSGVMRTLDMVQAEIIERQLREEAKLRITVPQRHATRFVEGVNQLKGVMLQELDS